ncbi:MAG: pilus assembly protein PilY, partial [Solimonas sp.]
TDVSLRWKRGCPNLTDDSGCSPDENGETWGDIGQTWAAPSSLKASGHAAGNSPLLIMGGGYDNCEDRDPNNCTASAKGNKVYVVDALDGSLLQTLPTDRSVIADVLVIPNKATGLAQYAYTADLGGNVYRITIGSAAPDSWTITKVASLGCATPGAGCAANRKFMFAPDVVEDNGEFILLLGSGDREKPLIRYTAAAGVSNYFFMIRDKPTDVNWLSSQFVTCGENVICLDSLQAIARDSTTPPTAAQLATKKGWYLGLTTSEQVVTSAITIFGVVNFSTQEPEPLTRRVCTAGLGTTRLYNVNYKNAASETGTTTRYAVLPPVGLPPSPVAGLVTLDDGQLVAFCIGCDASSPLEAKQPVLPLLIVPQEPKARTYWYIEQ